MATNHKLHEKSTKYFMSINQVHYVINLQNMKFVWLILWPGEAYTDDAYTTTAVITIPYYCSFHETRLYRLIMAKPNEPKKNPVNVQNVQHALIYRTFFEHILFVGIATNLLPVKCCKTFSFPSYFSCNKSSALKAVYGKHLNTENTQMVTLSRY